MLMTFEKGKNDVTTPADSLLSMPARVLVSDGWIPEGGEWWSMR